MRKTVLDKKSNCAGQDTDSIKISVLHLTQVSNLILSAGVRSRRMPEAEACGWKPCVCGSAFYCQPLAIQVVAFFNCRLGLQRDHKTNFLFDLAWVQVPRGERQLWLSTAKLNLHVPSITCENFTVASYTTVMRSVPMLSLASLSPNQTKTPPPPNIRTMRFSLKEGSSILCGTGVLLSSASNEWCSTLLRKIPFISFKFYSHTCSEFSGEQFLNCN